MLFLNRLFCDEIYKTLIHTCLVFLNIQSVISLVTGFWGIIVDSTMFMLMSHIFINSHSYVTTKIWLKLRTYVFKFP